IGAMAAPMLIKLFRVNNSVAAGVAIGTSSHVLGTAKALEIGETEGAMSGIAIGVSGILTVLFAMFIA
ncbi:MAG: LrgB family protein, partial [Christensenella sp.]